MGQGIARTLRTGGVVLVLSLLLCLLSPLASAACTVCSSTYTPSQCLGCTHDASTCACATSFRIDGVCSQVVPGYCDAPPPTMAATDNPRKFDWKVAGTCPAGGMCVANAHLMQVSLNLNDAPVGYAPPVGPAVYFQLSYNQRGASLISPLGPQWSHNFLGFITDDAANPGQNVKRYVEGGGYVDQTGYSGGLFARELQTLARLTRTPASGTATSYTLSFADGSSQTYGYTATNAPRRLLLTVITDAQGKSLTLAYDGSNRLTTITDATARVTTLSYTNGNPQLITKVTDPFGRFATLTYGTGEEHGKLVSITDVINITSTFDYEGTTTFIKTLTTPYGTSSFTAGEDTATNYRWLELTDPLGGTSRLEFKSNATGIDPAPANVPTGITAPSTGYNLANSFFWDSYVKANFGTTDYAKAKAVHWLTDSQGKASAVAAMVKPALDNPTYLNYPGQAQPDKEGTLGVPTIVGRKTDATTAQLTQMAYNSVGNATSVTDPKLRVTTLTYDATGVDAQIVKQKTASDGTLTQTSAATYSSHLPTDVTDAAGQHWPSAYNTAGQLIYATNPLGQTRFWEYDTFGRLTRVTVPVAVAFASVVYGTTNVSAATARSFHYPCTTSTTGDLNCNLPDWIKDFDGVDANGYQRRFTYDKFDRITQVTYPDATTETYSYSFPTGWPNQSCAQCQVPQVVVPSLDLWKVTDRQDRTVDYNYDRNRRRIAVSETVTVNGAAVTRTTGLAYYANGALKDLTDANGTITHWDIDLQSRPKEKIYDYCPPTVPPAAPVPPKCRSTSTSETYTYDLAGRLKTVTDALGQVKTIAYNTDGTPASYTYTHPAGLPDTANVSFVYDDFFPRLKSMTDMSGLNGTTGQPASATTTFDYRLLGTTGALQITGETNDGYYNQHAGYFYDTTGRLTSRWAAESEETFGYDTLGRLASYGTPLGGFTLGYLGQSGLPTSRSVTNSGVTLSQTYGYDTTTNDRRLLSITANTSAVRSYTYGYGYTESGTAKTDRYNIRTLAETATSHSLGVQSWVYDYDKGDRLMSAASTNYGTYSWGYDKLDNAKPIVYPASEFGGYTDSPEYNALNQQTKNAWWQTFAYDAVGNVTREWAEQLPSHALIPNRDYKYDMEGRLVEMTDPNAVGGHTVQFFYDGLGRRILQKTTSNGTTTFKRYLWCGSTICQQRDTGTNPLRRYLATGEYVNSGTKKYVYFQDHLGSVRDLVDATTGARVGALDYKPYGAIKATQPGGVLPDFQYAGLMWVGEVGLNASATRFLDPGTTRWMTKDWDDAAGALNGYGYNNGNPVMRVDPMGMSWKTGIDGAAVGAGVGAVVLGGLALVASPFVLGAAALVGGASLTYGIAETASAYMRGCIDDGDYLLGNLIGGGLVGGAGGRSLIALGAEDTINPAFVRFSQKKMSQNFTDGRDLNATIDGLRNGTIANTDIPPIRLFEKDGNIYSLDNRRLGAFKESGQRAPFRMATPGEVAGAFRGRNPKFSTGPVQGNGKYIGVQPKEGN